jgi:hypothetical protein
MAGTYVQIDRDELESWLDTLRLHGKSYRAPNKAGVYLLPFSDTVACKLSSTIGTSDDAMGRGMASMQLSLVSRVTGQTLNKKAQGQSHFKRTLNWKKTWAEGVERMRDAYAKSAGFYDALAAIEDRDQYKIDVMKAIESVPDWRNNNILADFYAVAEKGGILTLRQVDLLDRTLDRERGRQAPTAPVKAPEAPKAEDPLLPVLRALYAKARAVNNEWLMDFTKSVADQISRGRQLSPKQMDIIERSRSQFKVAYSGTTRYFLDGVPGKIDWKFRTKDRNWVRGDNGDGKHDPAQSGYAFNADGFWYVIDHNEDDHHPWRLIIANRKILWSYMEWSSDDPDQAMRYNNAIVMAAVDKNPEALFRIAEEWYEKHQKAPKNETHKPIKHVVDSATKEKLAILDELEPKIQNWPDAERAIKALRAAYEAGTPADDEDLKRVRNALYKSGMRPQADHFRMAMQIRVAERYLATFHA